MVSKIFPRKKTTCARSTKKLSQKFVLNNEKKWKNKMGWKTNLHGGKKYYFWGWMEDGKKFFVLFSRLFFLFFGVWGGWYARISH